MFTLIDWLLILGYLVFTFAVGAAMSRRASCSMDSYFVADRKLPWWWLGTSMVATTFAADTPLAITGIVAHEGIAGNWFIWCSIFTYITMTVFFARKWREGRVLTDVEFIELRYSGRPARALRVFKACYFSLIINSIVLGWVFRAMSKISQPFISWRVILGPETFEMLSGRWPSSLLFDNLNNTLTVLVILAVVVAYSTMGGIRGVIITDLFQFVLAMGCSVMLAAAAVVYLGGMDSLICRLHEIYPHRAESFLRFWPESGNPQMPLKVVFIYVGLLWWAQYFSDGSGYLAQRIQTARTPADAEKGSLWFTLACFVLRTWPWIIVALAALVLFPLDDPGRFHPLGYLVAEDREMGYPVLMLLILPAGFAGLMFASLLAAFMSTVDTHINWAASYLVNDIYKRFLRNRARERELVLVSRCCVVIIALAAVVVAGRITSIEKTWKFFVAMGAGMGLPQMLRWMWWRANAWTELAGIAGAFVLSVALYTLFPEVRTEYLLAAVVGMSALVSIAATLGTPPVEEEHLDRFAARVQPFGLWKKRWRTSGNRRVIYIRTFMWCLGSAACFSGMFCIGYVLLARWTAACITTATFVLCLWFLLVTMSREDRMQGAAAAVHKAQCTRNPQDV